MTRHILTFPGGEITSGEGASPAIVSLELTRSVNEGNHLTPGSVCPAEVEIELLGTEIPISKGDSFGLYEETDGLRRKLGTFRGDTLALLGVNRYRLTAKDGLTALDKDLTEWLKAFPGANLLDFARQVCAACGLTLKNETLLNADFPVRPFTAAVTGRELMGWVGQLSGCFCRADEEGSVELAWYARKPSLLLTPGAYVQAGSETHAAYQGGNLSLSPAASLRVLADDGSGHLILGLDSGARRGLPGYRDTMVPEGFTAPAIGQVRLRLNGESGADYPETGENPYTVTGNGLLLGATEGELMTAAQALYRKLKSLRCVPFRGQIPQGSGLIPGDVVLFRDRLGREGLTCVQRLTRKAGREEVLCRSVLPEKAGASLKQKLAGLTGKLLTVDKSVNGIRTTVTDLTREGQSRYSELTQRADAITARVQTTEETGNARYSELTQRADAITARVQTTEETGNARYSELTQRADAITARVQTTEETGNARYAEITQRADAITARVQTTEEQAGTHYSELTQRADGLNVRVLSAERQGQALTGNITSLQQALAQKADKGAMTEVKLAAEGLSLAVSALRETADGKADRTELRQVTEHFGFTEEGLRIYNSASGMGILVSQEQVAFTGGTDPTTVIRPSDLQTTNLRVGTRLDLGDFSFFPRSNGNLSFRYTGS